MGRHQRILADAIAEELKLPMRTVRAVVQRFMDLVVDDLAKTGRIELRGLGTFAIYPRKARKTIHPKTKKPIDIPASRVVRFRSSIALRRILNAPPPTAGGQKKPPKPKPKPAPKPKPKPTKPKRP